jgi:hypothetical protein
MMRGQGCGQGVDQRRNTAQPTDAAAPTVDAGTNNFSP